jgi:hypothetical protein
MVPLDITANGEVASQVGRQASVLEALIPDYLSNEVTDKILHLAGKFFFLEKEVIPRPLHQIDACGHFINKQIVHQSLQVSKSKNAHKELKTRKRDSHNRRYKDR